MISIVRLAEALDVTDEATIAKLADMRDAALAFIETQTRRYFGPIQTFTEYVRGTGTRSLYLRDIPLVGGIYTTAILETDYPGATGSAVTGSVQLVHGHEAELLRAGSSGVWSSGSDYAVTYSRGYAEDAGPKDIENLLIELVRMKINAGGEEVMKSETYGGYSYTRFDEADLDDTASATITSWRRLVYA